MDGFVFNQINISSLLGQLANVPFSRRLCLHIRELTLFHYFWILQIIPISLEVSSSVNMAKLLNLSMLQLLKGTTESAYIRRVVRIKRNNSKYLVEFLTHNEYSLNVDLLILLWPSSGYSHCLFCTSAESFPVAETRKY